MDDATRRQIRAADPEASTWLAANAGSGKTRVLTDRVARLLLRGVEPQRILCLTYTKAAASEMQNRLFRRLGDWAMKADAALSAELASLGEAADTADGLAQARRLFARAIETPGGLRIQTIHSFCAMILRRFPVEAGISPGFAELDDRAARLIRAQIVEEMAEGLAPALVDGLARHWSGESFEDLVEQIARDRHRFAPPLSPEAARALFGLPEGVTSRSVVADVFLGGEHDWMREVVAIMAADGSTNDLKAAARLAKIDLSAPDMATLVALEGMFLYGSGERQGQARIGAFPTQSLRKGRLGPLMPRLEALMARVEQARPRRRALVAAEKTAALHAFAAAWLPLYEQRKAARGFLDFDDLIARTQALLTDSAMAAWVLYRLDGGIDHILVDEAQDTSPDQWRVIESLTDEFTSQGGERARTIFVVGDKKQSIYSFQGADVAAFDRMRGQFQTRLSQIGARFQSESLEHSFRSSPAVLRVVDATFTEADHAALGGGVRHLAFREGLPGRVDLWPIVEKAEKPGESEWFDPVDLVTESHEAARLARRIAEEIAGMIASGVRIPLSYREARPVHAGDFLILVQRRSVLFAEVIRACKALGLPIAGADRLKLGAEMAVRDITALLSFLATPEDDLSLAAALRSPLFGWDEDALFRLAQPRKGYLWEALRAETETHSATLAILHDLRDQADYLRPYELIERVLTRHDGRRRLLARLGPEAEDGIDELLSQALAYERIEVPSLTGFLIWLETEEVTVKRQMDGEGERIRVMTVHGAKGLEAPIVILPDTADRAPRDRDELVPVAGSVAWRVPAEESPAALAETRKARAEARAQESLRLLYVAMTRARVWLIVAAAGKVTQPEAWYGRVAAGMNAVGATAFAEGRLRHAFGDWPENRLEHRENLSLPPVPGWVLAHPVQPEPPAPLLSPSGLGGAKVVDAGNGTGSGEVAEDDEAAKARGRLLHLLLEHLPGAPTGDWPAMAAALTADAALAADLLAEAAGVLSDPGLSHLFSGPALAEVALAAPWQGRTLQGVVDRLLLTAEDVLAIDFKSNRTIPHAPSAVPEGYLRQMGAYAHMLGAIYPGRRVRTAILWTRGPLLMPLDPEIVTAALARATIS